MVQASFQVAWTKAVSAKRHRGPAEQRVQAEERVQSLLSEFPQQFQICDLMQEDVQAGLGENETLQAVLTSKSPATSLKRWTVAHMPSLDAEALQ